MDEDTIDDDLDLQEADEHEEPESAEREISDEEFVVDTSLPFGYRRAAARVREFPQKPGVYLMKDHAGVVIYIGKAKNLRSRASSYFLKAALQESRTASWVLEICDVDFMECESEVDALLPKAA